MTEYQRGFADNYAGVKRLSTKPSDWLAGWDAAQNERLKDDREICKASTELHQATHYNF